VRICLVIPVATPGMLSKTVLLVVTGFVLARTRISLISLVLALAVTPLSARSKGSGPASVDQNYVSALATADRFLHAWQTRDEEAGILLLTDRVKQHTSEDALAEFFSSNSFSRESFEIGRGKKLAANRYQFPIALFQKSSIRTHTWTRPQTSALVVVKIGSDWAIDRLP
jgi:hypothetical protein